MRYEALGARAPSTSNNFICSSLRSKSDSQLSKYCVVCEIRWCRCQQLTASISTALVTELLVIGQLLHPALKFAVSASWPNLQLCPSSRQIVASPLVNFDLSVNSVCQCVCMYVCLFAFKTNLHQTLYTDTHYAQRKWLVYFREK